MFQRIRELSKDLAIYGLGDVAVTLVNFLLLPLYVRYLSPEDYGVLGLLGSVEVVAKIAFRFGLDGSFMRFWYDAEDTAGRQRLASTIFFFLLGTNAVLLAAALAGSGPLALALFGSDAHVRALQLVLLNTFAIGFTFFPFHLLRMEKRSREFSQLTLARSVGTLFLRIVLVVGFGLGVIGVVIADLALTAVLMLVLMRSFAPLIRPVFSRPLLRQTLAFGLPRVPHAAAQQVTAVGDKVILAAFRPVSDVGLYSMAVSFGLTQKLFLSAFEYAWAPFYYATSREPDAPRVFATVTTYVFVVLTLLTAGLSAVGRDLLVAMTAPEYGAASEVITWTAVGVLFQGVYLLTSIGLNITKQTRYYPVATIAAAGTNVGLNLLLIPRFGLIGAAWANAAAYALQAALAYRFSQRLYPIEYETSRILRVAASGIAAVLLARALPDVAPLVGVLIRGTAVVGVFGGLLWLLGFFKAEEMAVLLRLARRRPAPVGLAPVGPTELAGEIVATDLPEPADDGTPGGRVR